jgi:hypothetical protein
MTDEKEELRRWCHEFLGRKILKPEVCSVCNVTHESSVRAFEATHLHSLPDYTTDLNEAAKVEAKAIERAGAERYLTALDRICVEEWLELGQAVYDVRRTTADALTRCQASRAAVEGVL